jgi:hypothetical protein
MAHRKASKRSRAKTILRLPDLEQSRNSVLHSLAAVLAPVRNHAFDLAQFIAVRSASHLRVASSNAAIDAKSTR